MPWTTPSLEQVRQQNRDYVTARLRSGAMVPNSVLRVLADGNAGLAYLILLYIDWLSNQLLPDSAETEWLDRHAQIWIPPGRKVATFSSGSVTMTGSAGVGVPAFTQLASSIGVTYQTMRQIQVQAAPTSVEIQALDAGVQGNLDPGATLNLVTALPGVDGTAVVEVLHGGTDEETDDQLRLRVLQRIQNPPMGGDADDYVAWTLQVPGVTRAWTYPLEMGMGTVTVRFMMDDVRADNNGFPTADDVEMVRVWLNDKRPVAVKDFFVEAPIPFPLTMNLIIVPDSEGLRAEIETHIRDMLHTKAIPGGTIYKSWVSEAISEASVDHFDLTFDDAVMPDNGHLAVLDSIHYDE